MRPAEACKISPLGNERFRSLEILYPMWYVYDMVKTLELALAKAAKLPEAAQEELGLEILERIYELQHLKAEIEVGLRDVDAGLIDKFDPEEQLRSLHAGRAAKP